MLLDQACAEARHVRGSQSGLREQTSFPLCYVYVYKCLLEMRVRVIVRKFVNRVREDADE